MFSCRHWLAVAFILSALLSLCVTPVFADENQDWSKAATALGESRALRFRNTIVRRTYTAEQASKLRLSQFQTLFLNEDLPARGRFLQTLGLWPKDCDLKSTLEALAPDFSIDWYDPARHEVVIVKGAKTLSIPDMLGLGTSYNFLLSSLGLDTDSIYRTYLLEHCLQDQWFGLSRLAKQAEGNMDRMLALASVCEGDALLSTITALSESLRVNPASFVRAATSFSPNEMYTKLSGRFPALNDVPPLFRDYVSAVFFDGLKFATTIKDRGGWGALNRVLREGPLSSKQILHPLQYLQGEKMVRELTLKAPDTVGVMKQIGDDSAGEFLINCWASRRLGEKAGNNVGCGWSGDRWIAYEGKQKAETVSALLWASVWDSAVDAKEFADFAKERGASVTLNTKNNTVLAVWSDDAEVKETLRKAEIAL